MSLFSKETKDYVRLVDILGIHFQIRDDFLNLSSSQYSDLKGFAEDLTEGKFSFPVTIFAYCRLFILFKLNRRKLLKLLVLYDLIRYS